MAPLTLMEMENVLPTFLSGRDHQSYMALIFLPLNTYARTVTTLTTPCPPTLTILHYVPKRKRRPHFMCHNGDKLPSVPECIECQPVHGVGILSK